MIFVGLDRLFPKISDALAIVKPDTLPLASCRVQILLALEVETPWWSDWPFASVEIRRLIREIAPGWRQRSIIGVRGPSFNRRRGTALGNGNGSIKWSFQEDHDS
jgi:hypothetical protein